MNPYLGLLISYLAGSIPFAYLAGRAKGVDLRKHGSGNLGATNAIRVLGPRIGGLVYLGDTLKGMLPPLLLGPRVDSLHPELWAIGFGCAAILGHVKPIFLLGKGGGKGVATAGGVFFGLAPIPALIALAGFVITVAATRYASLGSIVAAILLPTMIFFFHGGLTALFVISVAIGLFVIYMHRTNIERLRNGTEPKVTRKKTEAQPA
ncbi:MAG TPA: glycerol-3-phosphate 1-O-acyltransferase PlsY [Gemmatimonadaceae bacterium]|nr:glycerol-3-phosphate 1-O-acyltransferase PlsY [Gemmatimonadaceae bacterium]